MKITTTPHKSSSKLTNCNTERPNYKLSPSKDPCSSNISFESKEKSPFKTSPFPKSNNKENFENKSPEISSQKLPRNKPRSLINSSKILKILNLTTKYEGAQEIEEPLLNNSRKSLINNLQDNTQISKIYQIDYKEEIDHKKSSTNINKDLFINNKINDFPSIKSKKILNSNSISKPFSLEELLRNPSEYYKDFSDIEQCLDALQTVIKSFSIKALMVKLTFFLKDFCLY